MQRQLNQTLSQFRESIRLCSGKYVAIDTETTGLHYWKDNLITVGYHCPSAGIEGTIDIGDDWTLESQTEIRDIIKQELKPDTTVLMHNAKFDMGFAGVDPVCVPWKLMDTTVMIHLWDSRLPKSLEKAEQLLLGTNSKREHIDDTQWPDKVIPVILKSGKVSKRKPRKSKIWEWHPEKRQTYCVNDCVVAFQLAQVLTPMLKKMDLFKLFWKDMEYLKQIYYTEHRGILLDQQLVNQSYMAMMAHEKQLEQSLWDAVGHEFNWRSNKQLSQAIYEGMGIPKPINPFAAHGDKGAYKTKLGFERIKELKGGMYNETMTSTFLLMEKVHHPLGELISALREASLLRKTMNKWLDLVDENGIIHTNFKVTGTRTGRLSSSAPNLANVASDTRSRFTQGVYSGGLERTAEYNLRNAFRARPGYGMLSIDFKQQEMRLFAWESQDETMLEAVKSGLDIHMMIAKAVWGDCGKEQNKIHREWSKTVGFGLLYGMTTGSLEHKLNLTREEAQKVIADYWTKFPRIRPYLFGLVEECKQNGYLRNWAGRMWRETEESLMYKGCNFMVQGGSADLLSIAAMRVHKYLHEHNCGDIVSYIYDELLMEIKIDYIEQAANDLSKIMEVEDLLQIRFLTDCKCGTTYGDTIEMSKDENGKWLLTDKHRKLYGMPYEEEVTA